ncbi:hypothetical protein BT96DRAFT_969352 [Gymnopus androsaceus JB14]|uniref:Uncharacterized protein n=1 Tax=Gymnopus androsaceus JB14 TaxID=1447944 RepID=A0A6A4IMI6_9AGAR|nr:hypothetical protein BT96DRAFT_969352 [Gymnopus androsaceus JB14]
MSLAIFGIGASRLAFSTSTRLLATYTYTRPHHSILPNRGFSSSSPRPASEAPIPPSSPELHARLQNTTLAKKLQQSPEALQAIRDFIDVLQREGLDVSSGKPPSAMQLMRLGLKKDVRDGMARVTTAMQNAGVDPTDKNMMAEIMAAMKK